jgi:hypothetical protein
VPASRRADQARHCDRIGEQHPAIGPKHAVPLGEDRAPREEMVDGIDTDNAIERLIRPGQRLLRVVVNESDAVRKTRICCSRFTGSNARLVDVDTRYPTTGRTRHEQRWPA